MVEKNYHVIKASIDGFHNPRSIRYKRGKYSPKGYYYDSFNYDAIVTLLLKPLGPDGNLKYRTSVFNFRTDSKTPSPILTAPKNSILLFDGVFLLRKELLKYWDFKIFVDVEFNESVRRASVRDMDLFGSSEAACERYLKRYVPGQKIYLKTVNPKAIADVVVKNNNPEKPVLKNKS